MYIYNKYNKSNENLNKVIVHCFCIVHNFLCFSYICY